MPLTLCCDERFGPADAADLSALGASLGLCDLRIELFLVRNRGAPNPVQLHSATSRGWTILTKDNDFRRLHAYWIALQYWRPRRPHHHAGILLAPGRLLNRDIVTQVVTFLRQRQAALLDDPLWQLQDGGTVWRELRPF